MGQLGGTITRFPNGIDPVDPEGDIGGYYLNGTVIYPVSLGSTYGSKMALGTVTTPANTAGGTTIASGLTTVNAVYASLVTAPVSGCSNAGGSIAGSGSISIFGVCAAGTAATTAGTAYWLAIGS